MEISIYGPPGSGKGTQAEALSAKLDGVIIAPGDSLRALEAKGELPEDVKESIAIGDLVSDRFVYGIVSREIALVPSRQALIFDGYPRNIPQAEYLDRVLSEHGRVLDYFVYLETEERTIVHRVNGRKICALCGRPAKHQDINCLTCGGELKKRKDDELSALSNRIADFFEQSTKLLNHYKKENKLVMIDGNQSIADVTSAISAKLGL